MTNEYNHIPVSDFPFKIELASFVEAVYHEPMIYACMAECTGLEDAVNSLEPTFSEMLLDYIDTSGKSDAEIYKKAQIDRRHFSKIRSNAAYHPRKHTVLRSALALELDLENTERLLESAGYALSHSNLTDVIVEFYIDHAVYDLDVINYALTDYGQCAL